ncbi:hypothetical protein YDYSY3_21830 [Paenibacillus chitinolyticus]|nr:hypothetical protein YDYSY3_21830 [Paenibacillus chitinolyticus]
MWAMAENPVPITPTLMSPIRFTSLISLVFIWFAVNCANVQLPGTGSRLQIKLLICFYPKKRRID